MKVTVLPEQTLSDIAIQEYGDTRAVVLLAQTNAIGITDTLVPGSILEAPEAVYDRAMAEYCRLNKVSPATSNTMDADVVLRVFTDEFTKEFI